ncbi:hypothetical protein LTR66_006982 [Elasticomyces elasticus]|nr:hypothetical protein LTR66_006982 [Elasticomyces elasticus]
MPRLTRAAAAAQAQIHLDGTDSTHSDAGDTSTAPPTPAKPERSALSELSPNGVEGSQEAHEVTTEETTPRKGRGGRKPRKIARGAKKDAKDQAVDDKSEVQKDKAQEDTPAVETQSQEPGVMPDDVQVASSPASAPAADNLMRDVSAGEYFQIPVHDARPISPPSPAVHLTKQQVAKEAKIAGTAPEPERERTTNELIQQESMQEDDALLRDQLEKMNLSQGDATALPDPPQGLITTSEDRTFESVLEVPDFVMLQTEDAMGLVSTSKRASELKVPATTGMRSTSNKENVEPVTSPSEAGATFATEASQPEHEVRELIATQEGVVSAGASATSAGSPRLQLRTEDSIEALDKLEEAIEQIGNALPNGLAPPEKTRKSTAMRTKSNATRSSGINPAVSKASSRLSTLARSSSVRESVSSHAGTKRTINHATTANGNTGPRPTVRERKQPVDGEKAQVIIPHSKPRPMTLSFPMPPPPPKSTKQPTRSTFQLPGEAVAAKLKAAREERLKREQEEQDQKREFKARPVPKLRAESTVRQTTASRVRQSLMLNKDAPAADSALNHAIKRNSSVVKRQSTVPSAKRLSAVPKSMSLSTPETPQLAIAIPKRQSLTTANTSKPRVVSITGTSLINGPLAASTSSGSAPLRSASTGTKKGKEVFNRAALEKAELEKAKREKEEAAKKARAAAAERGRLASREWAEKQRVKKLSGVKGEEKVVLAALL